MQEIHEIVAGTKFPASIGLEPSQEAAGIPLASSNLFQGTPKCKKTLAELQAVSQKLLVPGNDGIVYGDVAELNGHYKLSADMLAWSKVAELGVLPGGGESDANKIKGGHHHYGTLSERNAIPLALRRHGMNCSVWEGAAQVAADGKLLPREFKLTGRIVPGTPIASVTEQVQTDFFQMEASELNYNVMDPENYMITSPMFAPGTYWYFKASAVGGSGDRYLDAMSATEALVQGEVAAGQGWLEADISGGRDIIGIHNATQAQAVIGTQDLQLSIIGSGTVTWERPGAVQKQVQLFERTGIEAMQPNHPQYDAQNPSKAVPAEYYILATEVNANYADDLYLQVVYQGNQTYAYYDDGTAAASGKTLAALTAPEPVYADLGNGEEQVGTINWAAAYMEPVALFITTGTPDRLDLLGLGDQSDVWTEVLPGGSAVTVDQELDALSDNAIANSVVTEALGNRPTYNETPTIAQAIVDAMEVGETNVFTVQKNIDGTLTFQAGVGTINKFAADYMIPLLEDKAAGWAGQFINLNGDNSKGQLGRPGQEFMHKRRWYMCKSATENNAYWERNTTISMLDSADTHEQSIIAELETEAGWLNDRKSLNAKSTKGDSYASDTGYVYDCFNDENGWRRTGQPKTVAMRIDKTGEYVALCNALDNHDFATSCYNAKADNSYSTAKGAEGQVYYNEVTRAIYRCVLVDGLRVIWEKK